jgi:hypothetical protein
MTPEERGAVGDMNRAEDWGLTIWQFGQILLLVEK